MTEHALLSPSSANRWLFCPSSLIKSQGIPNLTNAAASRGTDLHAQAHQALLDLLAGHSPIVESEIATYVNFVLQNHENYSMLSEKVIVHLEIRLQQQDYVGDFKCFGTADCIIELDDCLHIIDYKSGHLDVEVFKNPQLGIYALLAQEQFKKPVKFFTIVQRDTVKHIEIDPEFLKNLQESLTAVQQLLPLLKDLKKELIDEHCLAGKWCKYCPARFDCATYAKSVSPMIRELPNPASMDNQKLGELLSISNFLADYISTVKKEAYHRSIQKSENIPGHKVIRGRGQRAWGLSEDEILNTLITAGYDKDKISEHKLLPFTKIEKIDAKAKEIVKELTIKNLGALKLVSEFEKGEAITLGGEVLPAIEGGEILPAM